MGRKIWYRLFKLDQNLYFVQHIWLKNFSHCAFFGGSTPPCKLPKLLGDECFYQVTISRKIANQGWRVTFCILDSTQTGFEFHVVFLLDWLPTKATEPSLLCYLTHSWWGKCFFKVICVNRNITKSARIQTRLTDFSSWLTNSYATGTSASLCCSRKKKSNP